MRSKPILGLTAAFLATAILPQGCRTIDRTRGRVTADDIPFETVNQPSRIARSTAPVAEAPLVEAPLVETPLVEEPVPETPVAETPVAETPVAEAPVAETPAVVPPPPVDVQVAPAPVTPVAQRPDMDTTPFEPQLVKSASEVGKPGSYVERVIPAEGGDRPLAVEMDGLTGQTGRHVSAPPPAPEPVAGAKPAPAGAGVYVVQPGDILGRVAIKHGVSRQAILDANPSVKDPNKLKVGQKLKIPPRGTGISDKPATPKTAAAPAAPKKTLPAKAGFTVYTVKQGDILGRIANAHKTTQKAILAANPGLKDPSRIRVGQQLYVPVPGAKAAEPESKKPVAPETEKPVEPVAVEPPAPAPAGAEPAPVSTDEFLSQLGIQ